MAEKINTKILDDEAKKEAITGEETSRYSGFNNKYLKAGIIAALSYYASKKNPYFLKGFADKIEEFEKRKEREDREFVAQKKRWQEEARQAKEIKEKREEEERKKDLPSVLKLKYFFIIYIILIEPTPQFADKTSLM